MAAWVTLALTKPMWFFVFHFSFFATFVKYLDIRKCTNFVVLIGWILKYEFCDVLKLRMILFNIIHILKQLCWLSGCISKQLSKFVISSNFNTDILLMA